MFPGVRWWRRRSLRARLTLLATAVAALGLAAGAVLLTAVLEHTQLSALDRSALRNARDVAGLVDAGRLPDPVPVSGTGVVQVVDDQDRVRAASASGDHLVPLLRPDELDRARDGERLVVPGDRIGTGGVLRVVAVQAGPLDEPRTVLVAVSLRDVYQGLDTLRGALLVTTPCLLLLIALLSWYVVGFALRPVAALRSGAEEIRGTGGSRRLPVPEARDEVHRLAVTLNDMLARLEAASARQRGFVADAAHELRSPLASIRTQLEVALRLGDADGSAEDVLLDVERLARLVDDLLLLARLDEPDPPGHRRQPVELAGLVHDLVGRYERARVPVHAAGVAAVADADPDGVRRAVTNLVDNAVRHAATAVSVRTAREGHWATVVVSDDGPGIPAAQRERVFDRFTRLDDARAREEGGAGLGLAIVRELVRAYGGTITLEDAEPGLRAVVRLPFARPEVEMAGPTAPPPSGGSRL